MKTQGTLFCSMENCVYIFYSHYFSFSNTLTTTIDNNITSSSVVVKNHAKDMPGEMKCWNEVHFTSPSKGDFVFRDEMKECLQK